jgi:hypothetical protein
MRFLGHILRQHRNHHLHSSLRVPLRPALVVQLIHKPAVVAQALVCTEAQIRRNIELVGREPVEEGLPSGYSDLKRLCRGGLDLLCEVEE